MFVRTTGAIRNPSPEAREAARLRGHKAGRLVRALIDIRPPYGVRELAEALAWGEFGEPVFSGDIRLLSPLGCAKVLHLCHTRRCVLPQHLKASR